METMEGLQSDLQDLAARIDNRQTNQISQLSKQTL